MTDKYTPPPPDPLLTTGPSPLMGPRSLNDQLAPPPDFLHSALRALETLAHPLVVAQGTPPPDPREVVRSQVNSFTHPLYATRTAVANLGRPRSVVYGTPPLPAEYTLPTEATGPSPMRPNPWPCPDPSPSPSPLASGALPPVSAALHTLLARAESHRRERPSIPATPLAPGVGAPEDYASSGTALELALQHLNESIPSGQRARTVAAYTAAHLALAELGAWLAAKEYL